MQLSLFAADNSINYSGKEVGPLIVALAFVLAVGGIAIAAVIACGWGHVQSFGVNAAKRTAEIVCK